MWHLFETAPLYPDPTVRITQTSSTPPVHTHSGSPGRFVLLLSRYTLPSRLVHTCSGRGPRRQHFPSDLSADAGPLQQPNIREYFQPLPAHQRAQRNSVIFTTHIHYTYLRYVSITYLYMNRGISFYDHLQSLCSSAMQFDCTLTI